MKHPGVWCDLTQVRSAICKSSDQDSRENAFQSTFSFAASAVYYNRTKYRGKYLQGNGKGFTITETLLYPVYYNRSYLNRIKRKLEGTSFSLYYIRNFTISSFTIAGSNCIQSSNLTHERRHLTTQKVEGRLVCPEL